MLEWIASEIILTEPLRMPAMILNMISAVFEKMDNNANLTLLSATAFLPPKITKNINFLKLPSTLLTLKLQYNDEQISVRQGK
jgi:hypothetical protein